MKRVAGLEIILKMLLMPLGVALGVGEEAEQPV